MLMYKKDSLKVCRLNAIMETNILDLSPLDPMSLVWASTSE